MPLGESSLLEWLRGLLGEPGYLGDDAARVRIGGREVAVTVDSQIAGVHFPEDLDASVVARRLLAVNLSDLAAVGARPTFAFLALNAPADFAHRGFLEAFVAASRSAGAVLAGGDLATTDRLTATLTLLGDLDPRGSWPGRGKARAGDALWVGGSLGESAAGRLVIARGAAWEPEGDRAVAPPDLPAGLAEAAQRAIRRHLLPEAQLELGRAVALHRRAASLDLSDGLARDLHRILRASEVGAEVEATLLPRAESAAELARWLDRDLLDLQLFGGEDYVLLFALPETDEPPAGCHRIGRITKGPGAKLGVGGEWRVLEDRGWDHLGS